MGKIRIARTAFSTENIIYDCLNFPNCIEIKLYRNGDLIQDFFLLNGSKSYSISLS